MKAIFEFHDYKAYLRALTGQKGARTGLKSRLADAAGCNLTYVSQVLHGDRDFSLEQAERMSELLNHTPEEQHYFLLLIQKGRAGTPQLKRYFDFQLKDILERRLNIQSRLGHRERLTKENQATYYSSWLYAATHVALSVPELQSKDALAAYFRQKVPAISEVLDFLVATGLANEKNGRYAIGPTMIHLGSDSKNIIRHHSNWRTRALIAVDANDPSDLHYSAAVTLSRADAERIKDSTIEFIKETVAEIGASKEEEVYCLALDFFSLKNS